MRPVPSDHFLCRQYYGHIITADQWKQAVQGYLASMSYADAILGHLLDDLKLKRVRTSRTLSPFSDLTTPSESEPFEAHPQLCSERISQCGGSDSFSGISATPVIGIVSDRLVARNSRVMLAEFPGLCDDLPELALATASG